MMQLKIKTHQVIRMFYLLLMLLASITSKSQEPDLTPDTITRSNTIYLRYKIPLNADTVLDYIEHTVNGSSGFDIRFYNGATKKELKKIHVTDKNVPIGKKHVKVHIGSLNVNCQDGHMEVRALFHQASGERNEYTMAIYRYDMESNRMKLIFSFPIASIGEGSTPDSFYHINPNNDTASCVESFTIIVGRLKNKISQGAFSPGLDIEIVPDSNSTEEKYFFNIDQNKFIKR